jgi:hypothetical protein
MGPMSTPADLTMFDQAPQTPARVFSPPTPHDPASTPPGLQEATRLISIRAVVAELSPLEVEQNLRASEGHNFASSYLFAVKPEATDSL